MCARSFGTYGSSLSARAQGGTKAKQQNSTLCSTITALPLLEFSSTPLQNLKYLDKTNPVFKGLKPRRVWELMQRLEAESVTWKTEDGSDMFAEVSCTGSKGSVNQEGFGLDSRPSHDGQWQVVLIHMTPGTSAVSRWAYNSTLQSEPELAWLRGSTITVFEIILIIETVSFGTYSHIFFLLFLMLQVESCFNSSRR
ncbi:hypothetical protein EV361DRAFT_869566 [Lentinula raphanica]|nr:hypothetical protein EV361DRAFT_869566 [Lentinula raphanica]